MQMVHMGRGRILGEGFFLVGGGKGRIFLGRGEFWGREIFLGGGGGDNFFWGGQNFGGRWGGGYSDCSLLS